MAERKRWDKQSDFHPTGSSSPAEAKADPVLTRQLQYLKVLEERNRVKKRLAAASKRSDRLHEREEAFVTAFNVPSRAASSASAAAAQAPSTSSLASRNTRSATSVLPTKMPSKLSKCRSAPSTTLNFGSSCGVTGDENRVRRAKWNRPQAPMGVAVEHHDGVPLFRLTTREEEAKSEDEYEEEEENCYLDESFEEFEEDGDERERRREELVIDDIEEDVEVEPSGGVVDSPVDLSKTTKELVGIIQHLSRTKQRALVDVLQKFQASEQDQDDVKVLQSSIGDPAIWKEISSTLNASTAASADSTGAASGSSEVPTVAPLKNLLEEQLRWEDQYASEMKERLGREREEKQRILKKAEERRAKMMKQLEDEEREIERLMEVKRQERLAKLRALQEEAASADTALDDVGLTATSNEWKDSTSNSEDKEALLATKMEVKSTGKRHKETREAFSEDEGVLYAADAKSRLSIEEKLGVGFPTDLLHVDAKSQPDSIAIVPKLDFAFNSSASAATSSSGYEIHVKLLSTWSKTRAVGLTQICVYDLNGQELAVDSESVQLFDQPTGKTLPRTNDMVRGLHKLFNGVAQTNAEKDMWLGRLGDSGVLLVRFEVLSAPSKLCVWNHNSKTHTACTRDIEVLVSGKCVWTGSLPETFGDPDDNTCTWIDLLSTARKTARTARVESSSMPITGRSDVKESVQWAHTIGPQQRPEAESEQKPSESTPLWLAGSSATSSTSDRSAMTSRSTANLDTWMADEKPSSGSVTSRRRQGKPVYRADSTMDKTKDTTASELHTDRADMKPNSSHLTDEKPRYKQDLVAPSLASLSSWDSLEKFSKTNRSRLPQPPDTAESISFNVDSDFEALEAKPKPSTTRTSFTTSALLTELRQGSMTTNVSAASYPDILKSSSSQQSFVDTTQFISSDVDKPSTAMIADIPVLPNGRWLQIEILSTWGDPYYVGLNGVEIFDHHGELVTFHDPVQQVTACPESINVLEENSDDPRVPKNLVDGVNFTCDDFHMWLAPFTPGQDHYVLLELNASVSISMLRIWNYNKSRTHTCRGVREARLILYDSTPAKLMSGRESKLADSVESGEIIFEGEIRQAPGLVGAESMEISNEVILFTQEAAILEAIEANDEALRALASEQQREDEETREIVASVHRSMELQRPRTSDAGSRTVEQNQESDRDDGRQLRVGNDGRPMTMATRSLANRDTTLRTSIDSWVVEEPQQRSPDALKMNESVGSGSDVNFDENLPRGRRLTLQLHSTWGDKNYVGLTQVVLLVGSRGTPIPLDAANVDATPRDLASLGYAGDPRTIDKLVDGEATTCDDTHMWLVPLEAGSVPEVRIELKTAQYFYGLRIWNYNKSPEDTYRGAKQLVVALDGVVISPKETGFLLRKAPGVSDFDFGQLVRFSDDDRGTNDKLPTYSERVRYPFATRAYKTPITRQDYEAPLYPQGFLLKIICWTTWGDPYYLGLNGLELYDFTGARIIDKPSIVTAAPYSVSDLDNSSGKQQDTRTPDNLLSGLDKNTWEAHDAWLAPFAGSLGNQQGNIVYVGFDTPVVLSMIKFWNYSKTPERGVKDVDIYLDDMHLFSGTLRKAPVADVHGASSRFGKVHKVTEQFGQAVLFSASQAQVDAEKRSVFYCGVEEQDVLGINEGQVMQESRAMYRKPDPGAEGVVVDLDLRPMTAVCRQ